MDSRDAFHGAGHLEVHLAEEVFLSEDVGDVTDLAVGRGEATDGDSCTDVRDRNTGVHQCQTTSADRCHRRRSVRLGDVRDDPDGVGKVFARGQDAQERAFRERAMPDFASSRSHDSPGFTRAERREVVVKVELLRVLRHEAIDDLLVLDGSQDACHEALRFTTLEERRTVRTREDRGLHLDWPDLLETSSIGPDPML